MATSQFDMWLGGQPGGDTPQRFARQQHSNANDQFGNIGLYNSEVDALVEKSEAAVDKDENVKLIKELQKKVLDLYALNYNIITQQSTIFYDARIQDFIIDAVSGQDYQYQAWFARPKEGRRESTSPSLLCDSVGAFSVIRRPHWQTRSRHRQVGARPVWQRFKDGVEPLRKAGKLGYILLQLAS